MSQTSYKNSFLGQVSHILIQTFRAKSTGSKHYYLRKKIDEDIYRKIQLFSATGYYMAHRNLELSMRSLSPHKYYESHNNKTFTEWAY